MTSMENQDQPPQLVLDHIAVAARTLDEGVAHVREALGIEVPPGGSHPAMGTHNRLMALGPELYLEIISVDPSAPVPDRARWFGLDEFGASPRLGTWVLSTDDIEGTLAQMPEMVGRAVSITRGDLSWLISVPDNGSMPMEGAFPTLIEWPNGSPANRMANLGCSLRSLTIEHPKAVEISGLLEGRWHDQMVYIRPGPVKKLLAEIETPQGLRVLS